MLEELRAKAEELLEKAENAETIADARKFEKELEETINTYTAESKAIAYGRIRDTEKPMHTAILEFYFPSIKVKEIKDKDSGSITRTIVDIDKPIDLGDLHKKLDGIGANKHWIYSAEKLNFYLTVKAASDVGTTVNSDAFRMNEISKAIDMGKTPLSNTNILKTLQIVISEMLGEEYKATSHDVKYLMYVYAQDNKKSKTAITAANHKTLRMYLKKVCYRILTNGTGYDVESREIRE